MKVKLTKKDIIEALQFKSLNPFYYNDSLYEAVYCSIVQHNDTIREAKDNIKCCRLDIKEGYNIELAKSQIEDYKATIKECRQKRNQLQKASALLLGEDFSEYNE